ncbi:MULTISPECIES: hypothetical protein [unclassified Shinella]|jgi:hypothetical protein|uniref:hypothetical protein n=1 Tax=unclassified Shinella TaxID=2643062 RepID=UPI000ABF3746|nr:MULTISPECIES: hypothetical protein [unclassified Shinella]MCA0343689.1 hypothetical protein [Pseudomonadota bacterium]
MSTSKAMAAQVSASAFGPAKRTFTRLKVTGLMEHLATLTSIAMRRVVDEVDHRPF